MKNFIKKFILFLIIIFLLVAFVIFGYLAYVDIKSTNAKDYLNEKYGLVKKDLLTIKSVEYVYEDIANCESLWFKKCTNEKELTYEHTFKLKDGTKIVVKEYENHVFQDNYDGDVINQDEQNKEN